MLTLYLLHTQGDNEQQYLGQLHNTYQYSIDQEWHEHFMSHVRQCMQYIQAMLSDMLYTLYPYGY